MAESFIQVPPDSTGKEVDTFVTSGTSRHRQAIVIADPDTDANVVAIGSDGRLPIVSELQLDYDTGGGSQPLSVVGIAIPGNGGATAFTGTVTVSNTTVNVANTTRAVVGSVNATITNSTVVVAGNIQDDAASTTTGPVKVGVIAKTPDGTDPGNVSAEDDIATLTADLNRRLFVNNVHPNFQTYHVDSTLAVSTVAVASPGAGLQLVLTNVIFSQGTTSALSLTLKQASTTGTTMMGPVYLEAILGRGFASGPIVKALPASTALAVVTNTNGNQSVDIDYFIQKV